MLILAFTAGCHSQPAFFRLCDYNSQLSHKLRRVLRRRPLAFEQVEVVFSDLPPAQPFGVSVRKDVVAVAIITGPLPARGERRGAASDRIRMKSASRKFVGIAASEDGAVVVSQDSRAGSALLNRLDNDDSVRRRIDVRQAVRDIHGNNQGAYNDARLVPAVTIPRSR